MRKFVVGSMVILTVLVVGVAQAQMFDITAPGDPILGVPDDQTWPAAEPPEAGIDDDTGTKFLHFKTSFIPDGDTGGAGFRVTPSQPQYVVTALNFASANDADPRDPVSFRLSGSNESIDGPYTLIAEGTIDEFSGGTAYPRNTYLTAPVVISNRKPYAHYELIFTELRNRGSANSVQIAEVELLTDGSMGGAAGNPAPKNEASDVIRDATLTWSPSPFPVTHDIYFGSSFDDVNTSTVPTATGLDVNSFDVGRLDFGATYFWRIDEVNTSPDKSVAKGDVWTFTVEPYSIMIPEADIAVTASSTSNEFSIPENTVNGSGLGADGTHSIASEAMWFTQPVDLDPWIQYEFNGVKKLDVMKVWNSNSPAEAAIGWGVKDVEIAYSVDGENWDVLADATQFSRAPGSPTYDQFDEIAFNGVAAKYVRFNIASNWGGILMSYSLSEVQFNMIPAAARTPDPIDGATDIVPNAVVTWRAGREAAQSTVYVGTDANDVAAGLAPSVTSNTNAVDLGSLDLQMATTYYWRVDEVNNAEVVSTWAGPVWSFTTTSAVVVDDFEGYNNISPDRPFQTWLDGYGYSSDDFFPQGYGGNGTGSGIGHDIWSLASPHYDGDIMEKVSTIAGSNQSMPFYYGNVGATASETERTFAVAQDWTVGGAMTLVVPFRGTAGNTGTLYVKVNNTKVTFDGPASSLGRPVWTAWPIDLSTLGASAASVTKLTIGVDGSGASGMYLIDDIRLYPETLELPTSLDITSPGDTVQGVPNDDDWPATEAPGMAFDDNTGTKYLHRKGGEMATGFQVEPVIGSTVVTGLTLTTANDDYGRDPINFELSGSNASIDGPYTVIASGDVVDFAQETSWPRFTKTETAIEFNNTVAYKYYQIIFPSLRPDNDGLMQIAEVELIGQTQ